MPFSGNKINTSSSKLCNLVPDPKLQSFAHQNNAGVIKFKQFTIFTEPLCEGGVLKFADQTHLINFLAALKARCKKENLSDLYDTLYDDYCRGGVTPPLRGNYVSFACIEKDGLSSDMFARVRRFKKIVAYIHKITLPKNVKIFAHLKDTDIHNWPPTEKRAFFAFCRNNMNRNEYNQFAAQVKGAKINLPAWDQIDVWCAEVNICNPGKLAAEVQKHVTLGPSLNNQKYIASFLAPHRKQIAEGKLVEAYVYLDNKSDAQGYLIPRVCLILNKPLNIAYFNQLKARHFVYNQAQNIFSPQAVRRVCDKLDQWNILERGFSYLDMALIPALSKINNEIGRSALLEIYGVLMVFRQLYNAFSWVRFVAGLSLLGEDITKIIQVWKYGTSAERALVVGSIIGLLFGPKAFKAANKFFADSAISFQARKIASGSKIQYYTIVQKGGKVYSIIPNKKTGFVTVIRDDGTAVAFKKGADGNAIAVAFKAAKGTAPHQMARGAAPKSAARPQLKKNPSGQNLPTRKPTASAGKPAYAQPRRGGYRAGTSPAPTSGRSTAPSFAMSVLARRGALQRALAPATRGINTVREMINEAAALMADGINATAATLAGTPHHAVQGAAGTENIPTQTTMPTQMASEGKPKDSNSPERQSVTGKSEYDPAEPISSEKKAELIRKLKGDINPHHITRFFTNGDILPGEVINENIAALRQLPLFLLNELYADGVRIKFDNDTKDGISINKTVIVGKGRYKTTLHEIAHRIYFLFHNNREIRETNLEKMLKLVRAAKHPKLKLWFKKFKKFVAQRNRIGVSIVLNDHIWENGLPEHSYKVLEIKNTALIPRKEECCRLYAQHYRELASDFNFNESGVRILSREFIEFPAYLCHVEAIINGENFKGFIEDRKNFGHEIPLEIEEYFADCVMIYYSYKLQNRLSELEKLDPELYKIMKQFEKALKK